MRAQHRPATSTKLQRRIGYTGTLEQMQLMLEKGLLVRLSAIARK